MPFDQNRLQTAFQTALRQLLSATASAAGHWEGELSTSALSTATAVMALHQVRGAGPATGTDSGRLFKLVTLIDRGLDWLVAYQNADGGWGDTVLSRSNISTTMLCHASLVVARSEADRSVAERAAVDRAAEYVAQAGGVAAVRRRYGRDHTFSVPILTHCALAGLVDWRQIPALPFELACVPARFYAAVRMPVVSYALPALIAIGQVLHARAPSGNPVLRGLRNRLISPSLRVLERVQPPNGGFLEATPLTSFVVMSLAGKGLAGHPVVQRGVEFLMQSVRPDGSWPIDTNLATWVTTLAVNAVRGDLPEEQQRHVMTWLLRQQYRERHPYTNAAPGGWAWTDLPGGVPDADDTPGAMLALMNLSGAVPASAGGAAADVPDALARAARWLVDLQNSDGGFPTFCRGWGTLPFDRSSPDITAHCVRALARWLGQAGTEPRSGRLIRQARRSIEAGLRFLKRSQQPRGAWLPLWFGNEAGHDDQNPVYGTSRVLMAWRELGRQTDTAVRPAVEWLAAVQHQSGGWGGDAGIEPSIEETALATEALLGYSDGSGPAGKAAWRGVGWLIEKVEAGSFREPSPIGFYFARLWYFETLYPLIFLVSALREAVKTGGCGMDSGLDR